MSVWDASGCSPAILTQGSVILRACWRPTRAIDSRIMVLSNSLRAAARGVSTSSMAQMSLPALTQVRDRDLSEPPDGSSDLRKEKKETHGVCGVFFHDQRGSIGLRGQEARPTATLVERDASFVDRNPFGEQNRSRAVRFPSRHSVSLRSRRDAWPAFPPPLPPCSVVPTRPFASTSERWLGATSR